MMIGKKFQRWTVLKQLENNKTGDKMWLCRCDCGTIKEKKGTALRYDAKKDRGSCGCLKNERMAKRMTIHGKSHDKIYRTWVDMMSRCQNIKDTGYHLYGARGIRVCKEWHDFNNFYKDMGDVPEGMTLDRVDNYKGYEASNCQWLTNKENCRKKRNAKLLSYKGATRPISEWAEIYNLKHGVLWNRLYTLKWSPAKALTEAVRKCAQVALIILLLSTPAFATDITLSWLSPTTNADGTPLTDLAGFRIYEKAQNGLYNQLSDIPAGETSSSVEKMAGAYCFVVTAYDTTGNESAYSEEACKDLLPPAQVYELRILVK